MGDYREEELDIDFEDPLWNQGFYNGIGANNFVHKNRTFVDTDNDNNGNFLQVKYTANKAGPGAGAQFPFLIEGNHEELYLSYKVKFAPGFDFVLGGKLPGLCGYRFDQNLLLFWLL